MIEARFTNKMKDILKSLKGCDFVGYSVTEFYEGKTVHDGKIYLHVADRIIKIFNKGKQIPWFQTKDLSDLEEIFSFACAETFEQGKQKNVVKETIKKVSIITDYIKIPQENYEIVLDMAVLIETEAHRYIISRGWQFEECLDMNIDKKYDEVYPVEQVVEEWNNFGEWEVNIKRDIEEL